MRGKRNKASKKNSKLYLIVAVTVILVAVLVKFNLKEQQKVSSVALIGDVKGSTSATVNEAPQNDVKVIEEDLTKKDFIYLSDMEYTNQSNTGWGNIQKDKNSDQKTISLRKDGEVVSYSKGMGFHAPGQLIYDISKYSSDFTHFRADVGVDASRPQVASIKVTISVSDDLSTWEELKVTGLEKVLKSADECVKVDVEITGKKYLRIQVSDANDGKSSDHCVLGDAKITRENYDPSTELFTGIKRVSEYDAEISKSPITAPQVSDTEISYSDVESSYNSHLKTVKLREFVNKFGYWSLQNYYKNEVSKNAIDWVLGDDKILDMVIEVGEIADGNTFFEVLGNLHIKEKDCLTGEDKEVYEKMMVAQAAVYSTDYMSMATTFGMVKPDYDYVQRFEIMKSLYKGTNVGGTTYKFEKPEQFKKLHVDLVRNVMNVALRNEELVWMNYHTTTKSATDKFSCHKYLSYISPQYKDEYYLESSREKYDSKYHLLQFNVPFADGRINREWMIIESGGVCWNISRVGQAVFKINGIPACGVYQPGHEAFMYYSENEKGEGLWKLQYNVGGWGKAGTTWGGGSRYRLPLNWSNKPFSDQNIGGPKGGTSSGYAILAQANLNDYSNFKPSIYYNLLANSYDDFEEKEKIYKKALAVEKLNLDSYDALVNLYNDNLTKNDVDDGNKWCDLAEQIITNYKFYPNAMHDLLELILPHIEEIGDEHAEIASRYFFIKTSYSNALKSVFDARDAGNNSNQIGEAAQLAAVYTNEPEEIATFSFNGDANGEHENEIVLNDQYKINYTYSIDGGDTWRKFDNGEEYTTAEYVKLTDEELKEINDEDDIQIKMTGTSNIFKIDISKALCDEYDIYKYGYYNMLGYYANDLENTLFEANESTEYCYLDDKNEPTQKDANGEVIWHSYGDEKPDLTKDVKIRIRVGRGGTILESKTYGDYEFTQEEVDNTQKYIPISEVKFKSGTEGVTGIHGDYAINGNYLIGATTSNLGKQSGDNYFIYEFNYPVLLSKVEYIPDCEKYGQLLEGEIQGSVDGENWTTLYTINKDDIKYEDYSKSESIPLSLDMCTTFGLDNVQTFKISEENKNEKIRFVKIIAKDVTKDKNNNNVFSARMLNFFEDTEKVIEEDKTTPTADIRYSTTDPTNSEVEATVFGKSAKDVEVVGEDTFTFKTNGTHTFKLKDSKGNTGTAVANVNWIDTKAEEPDVTFSTKAPTNGEVEAVLKPKEDIIVLSDTVFINDDNELVYKNGKKQTVLKYFGSSLLNKGKDLYIEKETGDIVATKDGEELVRIPNKVEDKETEVTEENVLYKHKFISNETYEFTYCDLLGNVGTKEVTVNWIDNTPPKGVVTYDVTGVTENPVTATIEFAKQDENGETVLDDDGNIVEEKVTVTNVSVVTEGVDDSAIKYEYDTNKIIFNKNCEVKVDFKDDAGNVGEVTAKVDWIEKILDSNDEKVEVNDDRVKNVDPGTSVKDLFGKLQSRFTISVLDSDGSVITEPKDSETSLKTGMKVEVNGNNYTIIVSGDVNGDGELSQLDVDEMCEHYLEIEKLGDVYVEAGDFNDSGTISLLDIAKMYNLFSKKATKSIRSNLKISNLASRIVEEDKVVVYVSIADLKDEVNAISGEVKYNKEYLTLTEVEHGNSSLKIKNNDGKFIVLKDGKFEKDEEIIRLIFEIKENAKGEIGIDVDNLQVSNGEFEKSVDKNALSVEIIGNIDKVPVDSVKIGSTSDKLKNGSASLQVGETLALHATITPNNSTESNATWSVGNGAEEYIEVTQDGVVTAKKITDNNGVKVIATVDGKSDECTIKVVPTPVTGISEEVSISDIYLVEPTAEGTGDNTSVKIVVNVLPDNATDKSVTWESSDTSVATVKDGVITAVADDDHEEGTRTCTITVRSVSNPEVFKKYTVHVNETLVKVSDVSIELPDGKTDKEIVLGEALELKAKINPENANFKSIEWSVLSGTDVVEVSTSGHVHTLKEGKATVRVTVMCQSSDCEGHTADIELTVLPKPVIKVDSVKIQGDRKITLNKAAETTLHVVVTPDDATDKTVIWESSDSEIVSVTDGILYARSVGTATITAKSGDVSDSITVEVVSPEVADLTIYTMTQDEEFLSGITLKLDKILNNIEIRIAEQTSNGKFDFTELEDGEYIIRAYKLSENSEKEREVNENDEALASYKFKVKDGKVLFENDDNTTVSVDNLIFVINLAESENKLKVENGVNYPTIEEDYQKYVESLSGGQGEDDNPSNPNDGKQEEPPKSDDDNKGEEPPKSDDNNKEEEPPKSDSGNNGNEESPKPNDNQGSGEQQPSGNQEPKPNDNNGSVTNSGNNGNSNTKINNSGSSNKSLPKTSDISIGKFVALMIISFVGIVCIIYSKKKHRK